MIDPPRAAVPDAVGKCRSAGIKVLASLLPLPPPLPPSEGQETAGAIGLGTPKPLASFSSLTERGSCHRQGNVAPDSESSPLSLVLRVPSLPHRTSPSLLPSEQHGSFCSDGKLIGHPYLGDVVSCPSQLLPTVPSHLGWGEQAPVCIHSLTPQNPADWLQHSFPLAPSPMFPGPAVMASQGPLPPWCCI